MTSLSIFNLNIMHGRNRKSALFPPRLSRQEIESNLQKISDCIHEHNPDIITLQEIDQVSMLSGNFNQFDYLDAKLQYPYKYFAPSCSIKFFGKGVFVSGNTIFSRYPLEKCESYRFDFSFPTDRMGFVVANVKLPQNQIFTVASLHLVWLDWIHSHTRTHQLALVEQVITARMNRAVIAGDFNCDLIGEEVSLPSFVERLDLKTYEPQSKTLSTHPAWDPINRIDYVFWSKDTQLLSYDILKERLSDHLATVVNLSV